MIILIAFILFIFSLYMYADSVDLGEKEKRDQRRHNELVRLQKERTEEIRKAKNEKEREKKKKNVTVAKRKRIVRDARGRVFVEEITLESDLDEEFDNDDDFDDDDFDDDDFDDDDFDDYDDDDYDDDDF